MADTTIESTIETAKSVRLAIGLGCLSLCQQGIIIE